MMQATVSFVCSSTDVKMEQAFERWEYKVEGDHLFWSGTYRNADGRECHVKFEVKRNPRYA